MNKYAKDNFTNELVELLSKYTKQGLSDTEIAKAYMPVRVLEVMLSSYFITGVTPTREDLSEPILSCTNVEDLANIIDVIECTGAKFATRHGDDMYKIFLEEINAREYSGNVIVECVMPFAITASMLHLLTPTIKSSDEYIDKIRRIETRPL